VLHSNRVKISKFSLPWQQGSSEQSLTDTIEFTDSENPLVGASIWGYQQHKLSYSRFCVEIANFRCRGNKGLSELNVIGIVELADPKNQTIEPKMATLCYMQPKLWQICW